MNRLVFLVIATLCCFYFFIFELFFAPENGLANKAVSVLFNAIFTAYLFSELVAEYKLLQSNKEDK